MSQQVTSILNFTFALSYLFTSPSLLRCFFLIGYCFTGSLFLYVYMVETWESVDNPRRKLEQNLEKSLRKPSRSQAI